MMTSAHQINKDKRSRYRAVAPELAARIPVPDGTLDREEVLHLAGEALRLSVKWLRETDVTGARDRDCVARVTGEASDHPAYRQVAAVWLTLTRLARVKGRRPERSRVEAEDQILAEASAASEPDDVAHYAAARLG